MNPKYYPNEIWSNTSVLYAKLSYDVIKMTRWQDLVIFNSSYSLFLNVPYSPFQKTKKTNKKMKHCNLDTIGF